MYTLGTLLTYCQKYLTFYKTLTGLGKYIHLLYSPLSYLSYQNYHQSSLFIIYTILQIQYHIYLLTDAARREARGPVAVRNPGQSKQIKGKK